MYKNKLFILTNLFILFILLKHVILKINECRRVIVNPGDILLTNTTYTSFQFINQLKYSSDLISDIYNINYVHIINTTFEDYVLFKGDVVLINKRNNKKDAIFKDSINRQSLNVHFKKNFKNNIYMNGEKYDVAMKEGYLEILFIKNCSNNSVLFENDGICYFKNKTYYEINDFLNSYYFYEKFITKYNC